MNLPQTHYEQVPVATVKMLTEQISLPEERQTLDPGDALTMPGTWRQLAEQVQRETDSDRLIELVRLLIVRYDEETRTRSGDGPAHRRMPACRRQ